MWQAFSWGSPWGKLLRLRRPFPRERLGASQSMKAHWEPPLLLQLLLTHKYHQRLRHPLLVLVKWNKQSAVQNTLLAVNYLTSNIDFRVTCVPCSVVRFIEMLQNILETVLGQLACAPHRKRYVEITKSTKERGILFSWHLLAFSNAVTKLRPLLCVS